MSLPERYKAVEAQAQAIENATAKMNRVSVRCVMTCGEHLWSARHQLKNERYFFKWLRIRLDLKRTTAWKWMTVYNTFKNCSHCEQFQISAMYLLAFPSTPEEVLAKALKRARKGTLVTYSMAKNWINSHWEKVHAAEEDEEEANPTPSFDYSPPKPQTAKDSDSLRALKKAWRGAWPRARTEFLAWLNRECDTFRVITRPHWDKPKEDTAAIEAA